MPSSKDEKALTAQISAIQSKLGLVRNNVVRYELDRPQSAVIVGHLDDIEAMVNQCVRISDKKEGGELCD